MITTLDRIHQFENIIIKKIELDNRNSPIYTSDIQKLISSPNSTNIIFRNGMRITLLIKDNIITFVANDTCDHCDGHGVTECSTCNGLGICECFDCGNEHDCSQCEGEGEIICEYCDNGYNPEYIISGNIDLQQGELFL